MSGNKFGQNATWDDFLSNCGEAFGAHAQGLVTRYPDRTADDEYLFRNRADRGAVKKLANQNPLTRAAIDYRVQMAVGTSVRIKPNPTVKFLGWDQAQAREFRDCVRDLWKLFMEADERWSDASGLQTISEQAAQHTRIFEAEGEAMAAVFELGESRRSPLTFNIGNVDPARVRTPHDVSTDIEERVRDGKLISRRGYPLGFFVHDHHPRDRQALDRSGYQFIATRNRETGREQFIHSYVQVTSDLSRGISQLASCLTLACQKQKYLDAALEDAIGKAGLSYILKSNAADISDLMGVLGQDADVSPSMKYMAESGSFHKKMGGVPEWGGTKAVRLYHGEDLDMNSAALAGGETFATFDQIIDNTAAACHGLSLEEYLQRWDKTNYSGARAGKLYVWNKVQGLRAAAPWRFVRKAYCLFLEDMILQGRVRLPGFESSIAAWEFFLENKAAITCVEFFGAPKDEIDRAKTADAYLAEGQLGVATWESYCNEVLGVDWEYRLDQIIDEVKATYEKLVACEATPSWSIAEMVTHRLFAGNAFLARKELRDSGALDTTEPED